jgi:hypothetical protein
VERDLNDVLGGADLLGNVIQRDRNRRRTSTSPPASEPVIANTDYAAISGQTSNMTDRHYDNLTSVRYDNMTDKPADKQADVQSDKPVSGQTDNGTDLLTPQRPKDKPRRKTDAALVEVRVREAQEMAKSPTGTVTLRIPSQLNAWLDEYVHGSWRLKVRKQELVTEALRMLFARRGWPGDSVMKTDLLENDAEP